MTVTAIIPAYNEEKTIVTVLSVVKQVESIDEILVVSDGSTDNTAKLARECGVKVIELEENIGKGGAVKTGVEATEADTILLLDADLIGLTSRHIEDLLNPILSGEADMTVGIFIKGRPVTDLSFKIAPSLSGQRAVRRELISEIENLYDSGFGIEIALTERAKEVGAYIKEIPLQDMTQVIKEEKRGLVKGFASRVKMYWDITKQKMPKFEKEG